MATSPQRAYRAACPNCGAPVEFASAASVSAVCGFCRSTLVRDGEALKRIGVSAELFDDHSPLQLGAAGTYKGLAFTLVGRLQIGYDGGSWNEWHALFDSGRSGWLSEDNGAYVFAFDAPWPADAPADAAALERLQPGQAIVVDGRSWSVASTTQAQLIAAQGELPQPPRLDGSFRVIDLRNAQDEVGTLDASDPARLHWSSGRPVLLAELRLSGLKDSQEKTLSGRSIDCPGCGASLEVKLSTTQSVTCPQCQAVTDISQGVGGELAFFRQNSAGARGPTPAIPLGTTGMLALDAPQPQSWQVVGYMERCDLPEPGDDEQSFWREYLLYNRELGFAFLVDTDDGWSWVRPLTGTPARESGERVSWRGVSYKKRWSYRARVTWVLGEFYWRVQRNEEARVTDYAGVGAASNKQLSQEQTAGETVWSGGETLAASAVAQAFGLSGHELSGDAAPLGFDAAKAKSTLTTSATLLVLFMLLMIVLVTCSSDDNCDDQRRAFGEASLEYQQCLRNVTAGRPRTGGSSWGGYSSGGGHK